MKLFEATAKYIAEERDGKPMFGLMGDANLGYLGAYMEREKGNYIPAAVEGGAVSMADGWARATGETGLVSVTHGPALSNTLTALIEAVKARTPLVIITGSTPTVTNHFQTLDIAGFARLAGADFIGVPRAGALFESLQNAFIRAAVRQTPVVLDIPYSFLTSEVEYHSPRIPALHHRRQPDAPAIDEAVGLLLSSKRPLIVAGRGAVVSGARESLLSLSRLANAPVMTTILAKDYFLGEPENLGIHGTYSTPDAIEYMSSADLVIAFGASLNNFTTDNYSLLSSKNVIHVESNPAAFSVYGSATQVVLADAKAMADAMVGRIHEADIAPKRAGHMERVAAMLKNDPDADYTSTTGGGYIDMRDATSWLGSVLPAGSQQVSDVGRFSHSTWRHITVDPARWMYAGAFGSIGLGVAISIGASVASRDRPTVLYVGDGGAMQGFIELSTAVREKVPLVVMVLNDQCYGAEYKKLELFGSSSSQSFNDWPSFADMAGALGAHSVRATTMDELKEAASAIEQEQFPLVIEVIADPNKVYNRPDYSVPIV